MLKVELANPHFKQRLQSEWDAEAAAAKEAACRDARREVSPAPMDVSEPLHITAPSHSRRKLKVREKKMLKAHLLCHAVPLVPIFRCTTISSMYSK